MYDNLYRDNYRDKLIGYEFARWVSLRHFIKKILRIKNVGTVLDYGSGSGLHINLWKQVFPNANLYFCDLSNISLEKLKRKYPEFKQNCGEVIKNKAPFEDNFFNVIISVEVIEHVKDLNEYLKDILRLLKYGGVFIWTTPCANRFSIEHIFYRIMNQIERTEEGYRRWKREDPTHLRRLRTNELKLKLHENGFKKIGFRFRAHIFSFICSKFFKGFLRKIGEKIMLLDYSLFRRFPNGASMIGCAYKK